MLGRLLFMLRHRIRLLEWDVEDARLARHRHIASNTVLLAGKQVEVWMDGAWSRVAEGYEATGEIWMGVALELECDRLGAAFEPDFTAHNSFDAIIDLTA